MGRLPLSIDPLFSIPPIPLVCGSSAPLQLHFPIPPTTVSGSSAPLHPTLCLPPPPPTLVCGSSAPLQLHFPIPPTTVSGSSAPLHSTLCLPPPPSYPGLRVVCPSPSPLPNPLFQAGRLPLTYSKRVVCPSPIPSGSSAPHLFQAGRLPLLYSKRVVCPSSPLYPPLSSPLLPPTISIHSLLSLQTLLGLPWGAVVVRISRLPQRRCFPPPPPSATVTGRLPLSSTALPPIAVAGRPPPQPDCPPCHDCCGPSAPTAP